MNRIKLGESVSRSVEKIIYVDNTPSSIFNHTDINLGSLLLQIFYCDVERNLRDFLLKSKLL